MKAGAVSIILCIAFISGCTPLAKMVVGERGLEIPQIVAHLEPSLKDNRINVSGKIVIQNPTQSSLDMDKIYLEIRDENKGILAEDILNWEKASVASGKELEAPVALKLDLAALSNKSIDVFIKTGFTYKKFGLHIPIANRVAVLHLDALKETITRPLNINIVTKLHSSLFGNSSVDFVLSITNPLSIDLSLEDGLIRISTLEDKEIAASALAQTVFRGAQLSRISDSIKIGSLWARPAKFQISGKLSIPGTDLFMPFRIESALEVNLLNPN